MNSLKGVVWSLHFSPFLVYLRWFFARRQDEALARRPVHSYSRQNGVDFARRRLRRNNDACLVSPFRMQNGGSVINSVYGTNF